MHSFFNAGELAHNHGVCKMYTKRKAPKWAKWLPGYWYRGIITALENARSDTMAEAEMSAAARSNILIEIDNARAELDRMEAYVRGLDRRMASDSALAMG